MGGRLTNKNINYRDVLSSAIPLTTTRFFGSLIYPIISIILPFTLLSIGYTQSQALSMLGIAMGMTFPILTIPSTLIGSLSMVLIPEISSMYECGNIRNIHKQIKGSINFTMCCSFICIPLLIGLAEPLCVFLFDNIEAGLYLKFSSWTIVPTGLSTLTTSILNSLGKEKYTFKYFLISTVITLLVAIVMPLYINIYALFLALGVGMIINFILNIHLINKTLSIKQSYMKEIFLLILITTPTTLLTKWLYNIFILMYGNIVSIIISSIITTMCFTLLLIAFNIVDIKIIFEKIPRLKKIKTH
jgi:O-antigen/teichoic acid export membrane protein